jgi:hypothetical protein
MYLYHNGMSHVKITSCFIFFFFVEFLLSLGRLTNDITILHSDSYNRRATHVWCAQVAACTWCALVHSATSSGAGSVRQSGPATVWAAIGLDRHAPSAKQTANSPWLQMGGCFQCSISGIGHLSVVRWMRLKRRKQMSKWKINLIFRPTYGIFWCDQPHRSESKFSVLESICLTIIRVWCNTILRVSEKDLYSRNQNLSKHNYSKTPI